MTVVDPAANWIAGQAWLGFGLVFLTTWLVLPFYFKRCAPRRGGHRA